jgi:transcriptional activator of cad operon
MDRLTAIPLKIGAWRVDPRTGQLSREGEMVRVEARTLRLLLYLAQRAGEVVSLEELLDQVWSGVVVTQDSVYQGVASLRRVLGDDPKQPTYIATVPRLGYRMVASVSPWVDESQELQLPAEGVGASGTARERAGAVTLGPGGAPPAVGPVTLGSGGAPQAVGPVTLGPGEAAQATGPRTPASGGAPQAAGSVTPASGEASQAIAPTTPVSGEVPQAVRSASDEAPQAELSVTPIFGEALQAAARAPAAASAARSWSATTRRSVVTLLVATALVALIALITLNSKLLTHSTAAAVVPSRSVGVLPFLDLTSESMNEEYFADGMTEELIGQLARIPGLYVPAPTASFYFKGKQLTVADVAHSLGVAYVLDGSVRKSDTKLRIAARLVRASDGYIAWSNTYDRPEGDRLWVQQDIAAEVAKALPAAIR